MYCNIKLYCIIYHFKLINYRVNALVFFSNPAVKVVRHSLQEVEDNGELKEDKSLLM